jgi:hypothetical protein
MSHTIEYSAVALRYDVFGLVRPRFVVAAELGANNCTRFNPRTGREVRARDWQVQFIGDEDAVIEQAIWYSTSCATGAYKVDGRFITPQTMLRRVRRMLRHPLSGSRAFNPTITMAATSELLPRVLSAAHEAQVVQGLPTVELDLYYSVHRVKVRNFRSMVAYWDLAECHASWNTELRERIPPHDMGQIWGDPHQYRS